MSARRFHWRPWLGILLVSSAARAVGQLPQAPPGFKVDVVASAQPGDSWVSMAIDDRNRLIVSPEGHPGYLAQITLGQDGQAASIKRIDRPTGSAMGLLYAFDSLYVDGDGPKGFGVYRLRHNAADDSYGWPELIAQFAGYPPHEHGAHGLALGPDQRLYIVCGNYVTPPNAVSPTSPFAQCNVDQLLPVEDDPDGVGVGLQPPGGFILRVGPNGETPEVFCGGLRNIYGIAFNADNELFGVDNDAESDAGLPWYRPNRLLHLVSGGDYGYREGSAKIPDYDEDALPSVCNLGLGAYSGAKFGDRSNFPPDYKTALFALDWGGGRIVAVHLTPKGASFTARTEVFLQDKPLNATALEFASNGPMCFITGGRGTESRLYRVTFVGLPKPGDAALVDNDAALERRKRNRLEYFHGRENRLALDTSWPDLDGNDRFVRFAARLAIESQPLARWEKRAFAETHTNAALTALLAVARNAGPDTQEPVLKCLERFPLENLSTQQKLMKLRAIELAFIRLGGLRGNAAGIVLTELERAYPSADAPVNAELCQLLVYLGAPDVVSKTLKLIDAAATQEEQIWYVYCLRNVRQGWTLDERRHYLAWFTLPAGKRAKPSADLQRWHTEAARPYADGAGVEGYLADFRAEALASLSAQERATLNPWLATLAQKTTAPAAPKPRAFVRNWTMDDLAPLIAPNSLKDRTSTRGSEVFAAAGCVQCHRFGGTGGAVGPDLTTVGRRYDLRYILESIVAPSKVVADPYRNTTILTTDGDEYTGRIVGETAGEVSIMTDVINRVVVKVVKNKILKREVSKISPMPQGLLNSFTSEEILDLLAYLESGAH